MALYAYAVVEGGRGSLPAVAGVNGANAQSLVTAGAVAAVVSEVDVADFEGAGLERNAADAGWLESAVRAHERAVEGLLGTEPVVPMRFGSILSSPAALPTMLTQHAQALA